MRVLKSKTRHFSGGLRKLQSAAKITEPKSGYFRAIRNEQVQRFVQGAVNVYFPGSMFLRVWFVDLRQLLFKLIEKFRSRLLLGGGKVIDLFRVIFEIIEFYAFAF
jgi:hypothetical protein